MQDVWKVGGLNVVVIVLVSLCDLIHLTLNLLTDTDSSERISIFLHSKHREICSLSVLQGRNLYM